LRNVSHGRLASVLSRLGIVAAAFAAYAAICLLFSDLGVGLLYLLLVPVALGGALFRLPGGVAAAVLGYLLSELLYRAAFPVFEDYTTTLWLLDLGVTVAVGAITGYLSGMIRRQRELIGRLQATVRNKELLARANQELQSSISALEGSIPICSFCKKIRVDEDSWVDLEQYLRDRSGLDFGPIVCPSCAGGHERGYLQGRESRCPLVRICAFFARTPATAALREMKYAYCYTEHRACEIFTRVSGGSPVPHNLLPDGVLTAEDGPGL